MTRLRRRRQRDGPARLAPVFKVRPVLAGLAVLLGATALGAQQTAPPPQTSPTAPTAETAPARAVFRAGVEYVAVDVVVTDHDKAVTDLTADDFQVLDHDVRQRILDFQHVSVPLAHRKVDLHARTGPPPDVATNTPVAPTSQVFVVVLDEGATHAEDLVKLQRALTTFLEDLAPTDRVAVVYIHRSDLGQDFTSDTGLLVKAFNNFRTSAGWMPDPRATRLVLVNAVAQLADAPETRRAIIYVSSGFLICHPPTARGETCVDLDQTLNPGPPTKFTPLGLQDLFDRARRSDVPIYTLDPQGLLAPSLNLTGHLENQTPQARQAVDRAAGASQDFVRLMAANTGGLAYTNTNDLTGAMDGIVSDNGDYYVLGYSPSPYTADNKFHSISVSVPGRPGLKIRGRTGYVAAARATGVPSERAALLNAVAEAQPQTDLALRAFMVPVTASATSETAILTLTVTYPAVTGDDDLHVELVAADADGHVKRTQPRAYHVALGPARAGPVTVSFDDVMDLPFGKWTLVAGVQSTALGKVGTLHLPVDAEGIRPPIALSPLILGYAAKPSPAPLVANPEAIAGLVPLQPTTDRTFAPTASLQVFGRVFATKLDQATTVLTLRRGESAIRTLAVSATPLAGNQAEDCLATLDLQDLPAGDYILSLTAKAEGKQTATEVGFRVQ